MFKPLSQLQLLSFLLPDILFPLVENAFPLTILLPDHFCFTLFYF